jgi:hypothetical protein
MDCQYFGSTQIINGATYLDTRTILHIEEGFQGVKSDGIGNSTEYINIGDFEISDFNHGGALRESLQINAHSLSKRTNYMNSYFPREYKSAYSYYEDFNDQNLFDQNWTARPVNSGIFGLTNGTLHGESVNVCQYMLTTHEFEDYRIITKMKAGLTYSYLGMFVHLDDFNFTKYYSYVYDPSVRRIILDGMVDGGLTTYGGVSYCISANTNYWFMLTEFRGLLKGYYSTDGKTYSLGICRYFGDDPKSLHKGFAYLNMVTSRSSVECDYYDIQELKSIYTKEDIINSGYKMGGINGVTIASEISGITNFNILSTGTCAVYGSSNNVFISGDSNSILWNTLTTTGNTFGNFVLDIEARGSINSIFGLLVDSGSSVFGPDSNWYGNYIYSNSTTNNNNVVNHCIGGSQNNYLNRGNFWNLIPDNWYRLRLIKDDLNLVWEVNDQIINSFVGTSIAFGGTLVHIGLFSNRGPGITTEFRNFRISQLDDIVDEINIEPGSQVQSLIDRILPDGYAVNNKSGNIEIYKIGDNRGTHYIGLSDYTFNSKQELSNINGKKYILNKYGDNINIAYNKDTRILKQADSNRINIITDDITPTLKEAESQIIYENKDNQVISLEIANRPTIEQYDTLNLVDDGLGISGNYVIFDFNKTYSAEDGQFRETLKVNKFE